MATKKTVSARAINAKIDRMNNPGETSLITKRGKNPRYRNEAKSSRVDDPAWIGYAVHRPTSPNSAYAILKTKDEAVDYAQKLATAKGFQLAVTRIRYNVAQS